MILFRNKIIYLFTIDNKNKKIMKKAIFVILTAATLVACNNTTTTPATADSCKTDSCKAKCDSTVKVDTVKGK